MKDETTFNVTLHQLSPDAKQADRGLPDMELAQVNVKKIRELIRALAKTATHDLGDAKPELRVHAPHGRFIVQVHEGRLHINSWDIKVGGTDQTPDQIFGLITGVEASLGGEVSELAGPTTKRTRRLVLGLIITGIVISNAFTAWYAMREPPNPFLPEHTELEPEQADRFFAEIIGEYQTGANEGDRALVISKDRRVRWMKFGPKGTVAEELAVKVEAVRARGVPALLADDRALIDAPEPNALLFYNETYRRKTH